MGYFIYLVTLIAIYMMVIISYAVPVGWTGLLTLGHISLLAVGAYTAAILMTHGGSFWFGLLVAALAAGGVSFLLALTARRIKEDYFTFIPIGFIFVVNAIIVNWTSVTKGPFGITGIERPSGFEDPFSFMALTVLALLITAFFLQRVVNSPFGRALESVRDDDLVAESLGKPVAKLRIVSLVTSGVFVGGAGAFVAAFLQFINAQVFWLDNVIFILAAIVVGGLASFRGAIVGTLVLYLIFEPLRFLPFPPGLIGSLRLGTFSLLLLLVVIFRPKGIMGRAQLGE